MSKFKVGDEVKVIKERVSDEFGGNNSEYVVGNKFIIKSIEKSAFPEISNWLESKNSVRGGISENLCELVEDVDTIANLIDALYNLHFWDSRVEIKEAVVVEKPKEKDMYCFRDIGINFKKLCIDALEDDTPAFLVYGKDKAYVGLINSGKSVGVPMVIEDFQFSQNILNFIPDLPYGIFEISKDKIYTWKMKLKQYSMDYKEYRSELDKSIKNRNRKKYIPRKDLKDFKVLQFK